jgi:RNA polymerase subunit RPABC4/transcription elongation factor Spt4
MPSSITCQRCQYVNEPYATTCQQCGARFCPSCKLVIDSPTARVCPHCGKTDLTFKPGKYSGSTFVAPEASSAGASQSYCSNCGSKIEPGIKKCPYCGRLGPRVVTQSPVQGFGVMKPAHGIEEPPQISMQKVCSKCGTPIPPGSSLCPIHGKFGGGNTLSQSTIRKDTSIEAEAYRRMAQRGSGLPPEQTRPSHQTPPEEIYPQMGTMSPQGKTPTPQPETADQRICPNCNLPVPDRSKVCPNCGNNRLPAERSRPITKAEDFYKAREASGQSYPYAPPADSYYGQPPADSYYGQPAVQPYEASYPSPTPGFIEEIRPEEKKKRKKEKIPKEPEYSGAPAKHKKFPWSMLLALLALIGVGIVGVVLVMDMLRTPASPTMLPSTPSTSTPASSSIEISNIQYADIGKTSATVTWTTNVKSNSIVSACEGDQCINGKDDALVTNHVVKLTQLDQGKTYKITVKSMVDENTDASVEATEVLRTTDSATVDKTPPKITQVKIVNMVSAISSASATVTWQTDEPATSQVHYGTSINYGTAQPSETDTTLVKDHEVMLQGLSPQSTFHYKVISRDADGNEASSADATFTTPAPAGSGIGNIAPDFTLDCADGSSVTLSSLRGSKVILNFWHTSCAPCMEEISFFQQMHVDNPSVPILCVHGTALGPVNTTYVGSLLTENGYAFTVPLDITGQVSSLYSISTIPKTFFLDSNGVIKAIQDGSFPNENQMQSMLGSY